MHIFKNKYFALAFLLFFLFFLNACSTKKNTATRRAYHNVLAKYNGYFNGNESLKEGVADLAKGHEDNYNDILHIFKLGSTQQAQSQFPKMDRAIEKASKVIRKHSMTFSGREYVKWISRSYMMIGKANFYKKEYEMASETFEFVLRLYNYDPIRYEAYLNSAKTNNITKNFGKSESMLEQLDIGMEKGELNKKQQNAFYLIKADLFIKQEMYEEAAQNLTLAIKSTRKKKDKVRYNFILGQIYQKTGDLANASKAYNKVIRMNPPYELEFNAKINAAMCYDATSGQSKSLVELLTKMLKDDKNKEYLDQIYYAMAQVALKDKNTEKAIEYLKLSAEKSVSNDRQKAVSFLNLAELHYEMPDYINAQAFYDSTVLFLPKDYKNYDNIEKKQKILSELVKNIVTVELEDSLQRLSKMSEAQRIAVVDKIIADLRAEEIRKQKEESERQQSMYLHAQSPQTNTQTQGNEGKWYFYNPSSVSFGYSEFMRKWGNRKLEDNWRLSNKEMVFEFEDVADSDEEWEVDSITGEKVKPSNDPKDRSTYLKNIPTTPEMLAKSHEKIVNALYNIGNIYKDNLQEYKLSNDAFEKLNQRYPDNKYMLNAYYHLYRTYGMLNDKAKSDYYKNIITSRFSDSEHAKIINDPDYVKKKSSQQSEAEVFYTEVYNNYQSKNYATAMQKADEGIVKFKGSVTESKFAYIKTLCVGRTQPKQEFEKALGSFLSAYPKSLQAPLAQDMLDYLQGKIVVSTEAKTTEPAAVVYNVADSVIHFYILIFDASKMKVNDIKVRMSNYNSEFHRLLSLTVSNVFLDDKNQLITVANFQNKVAAMKYYETIKNNKTVFEGLSTNDYKHFVISVDNYPVFYKDKNVEKYMAFFKKNYL